MKKEYMRRYEEKRRGSRKEYFKKYDAEQRDPVHKKERMAEYWRKNRERLRQYHKQYNVEHRNERIGYAFEYYYTHRKEALDRHKIRHFGSVNQYLVAINKFGGKCTYCDNEAKLVHHVDGKNGRKLPNEKVDNRLSNLLPLCKGCHNRVHERSRLKWAYV